jgi:hypothetical protein
MNGIKLAALTAAVALGAMAGLQACGEDTTTAGPQPDAGFDVLPPPPNPPPAPGDAGSDATDATVTYMIPPGGGSVDFTTSAVGKVTFTFPASAAGTTITLAPSSATALGWPADQFLDAIKMGPDGTRFADPVGVKFEKPALVGAVLSFADNGAKGPASPVDFDQATGTFVLRHFTSLAILPPDKLCDSQGSNEVADAGACADAGAATSLRTIGCKGYNFCLVLNESCCVDPAADSGTSCSPSMPNYAVTSFPTGSNGGQYPYCDTDAGDWDGGPDSGCSGSSVAYSYAQDGGCAVQRDCAGAGYVYKLSCDGTNCSCDTVVPQTTGTAFPQTATCDNTQTMRTTYVQHCNFPPN